MAKVQRTVLLKKVVQRETKRFPPLSKLNLHVCMGKMFDRCTTVWDRHYPSREKVTPGKRCIFFRRVDRPGKAVLFHAYSYVAGLTPDQAVLDDIAESINADPIETSDGTSKEIVERFAVMVVGEVMIIEAARVQNSGDMTVRAMRDMLRRHVNPAYPSLGLEDAPTVDFKKMSRLHDGVVSFTARMHTEFTAEPQTSGRALEETVSKLGFKDVSLSTTVEAKKGQRLSSDKVGKLLKESEQGTGLSGITIRFGDETYLRDLDSYREKLRIKVKAIRPGVPDFLEIEESMVGYLRSLVRADKDSFQLINSDGLFT